MIDLTAFSASCPASRFGIGTPRLQHPLQGVTIDGRISFAIHHVRSDVGGTVFSDQLFLTRDVSIRCVAAHWEQSINGWCINSLNQGAPDDLNYTHLSFPPDWTAFYLMKHHGWTVTVDRAQPQGYSIQASMRHSSATRRQGS